MLESTQVGASVAGIEEEFRTAQTTAVLIDRSSVGKLRVTGADGLDLLHRLSTNDLSGLKPLTATWTVFTTDKGRIVDFVRVVSMSDSLLLITSPSQEERLKIWIEKYTIMEDLSIANETANVAMFSIIGPRALELGQTLFDHHMLEGSVLSLQFAGVDVFVICESSFATKSVNVLAPAHAGGGVWKRLEEELKLVGVTVMGDLGYEVFRIFHGIPRENHELTDAFNPYETGLSEWMSSTKGCYIGQEVIARLSTYDKIQRKLVLVSFAEPPPLEHGKQQRLTKDEADAGFLTSLAGIPIRGEYMGLGVVRKVAALIGNTLTVPAKGQVFKGIISGTFSHSLE